MKTKKITTELMVLDMDRTIDFYQNLLGFKVTVSVPEEKPFFAILKNDSVELMLYTKSEFKKEIPKFGKMDVGGSIALYIGVDDIKSIYKDLKNKVKIIQELHTTDYGTKEFSFEDINGYVLMLNESK